MKWIKSLLLGVVLMVMVGACLKQPEYSNTPQITFNELYFKKGNLFDTLAVVFDFKDGDGDLGTLTTDSTNTDLTSPWYYLYDISTFQIYYTGTYQLQSGLPSGYKWVDYASKSIPQLSSQISFPALGCHDWETINDSGGIVIDTLYITQNDKAFNIIMKMFIKDNSGSYSEYNPDDDATNFPFPKKCATNLFKGTFKNISSDPGRNSPMEGTFTYRFPSPAWASLFGNGKVLKLQLYIVDRALHQSNTIEKSDFTLTSITKH